MSSFKELAPKIKAEVRIIEYAEKLGYTVIKKGSYYSLKEHDSVIIDDRKNCFWRNSQFIQGQKAATTAGSIIDFVMHFEDKNLKQAMETLSEYINSGAVSEHKIFNAPDVKPVFKLPDKGSNNNAVINYLVNVRGIDSDIVHDCIDRGLIYQDDKNNAVFVNYDKNGKADFACLRGTYSKRYVRDISGSNYNSCIFINNFADTMVVTESIIDALSYMCFIKDNGKPISQYNYNALSSTTKISAVLNNLSVNPNIHTVIVALDNDDAGRRAGERLKDILKSWNGKILMHYPPHAKDWNDELLCRKKVALDKQIDVASKQVQKDTNVSKSGLIMR